MLINLLASVVHQYNSSVEINRKLYGINLLTSGKITDGDRSRPRSMKNEIRV